VCFPGVKEKKIKSFDVPKAIYYTYIKPDRATIEFIGKGLFMRVEYAGNNVTRI